MKPWHLCSEAEREDVIRRIFEAIPPADYGDAWEAAITLLRDAAPWPDEALVVSVQRWQDEEPMTCEIVDVSGVAVLLLDEHGVIQDVPRIWPSTAWWPIDRVLPLTPAAAEFLAALGGGE